MADSNVVFIDNSIQIKNKIQGLGVIWLYEAIAELQAQVMRNTAVDTGQLKGSWQVKVDESDGVAIVGSPLENAIWEEFGTGVYALNGNGRKKPWGYTDRKGKFHWTHGKKPRRALHNAFESKKKSIIARYEDLVKRGLA